MSDFYSISVKFAGTNSNYTYKVANSVTVAKGDFVVVKPRGCYAVAEVFAVSKDNKLIDPNAKFEYAYIVQRIDPSLFDLLTNKV